MVMMHEKKNVRLIQMYSGSRQPSKKGFGCVSYTRVKHVAENWTISALLDFISESKSRRSCKHFDLFIFRDFFPNATERGSEMTSDPSNLFSGPHKLFLWRRTNTSPQLQIELHFELNF